MARNKKTSDNAATQEQKETRFDLYDRTVDAYPVMDLTGTANDWKDVLEKYIKHCTAQLTILRGEKYSNLESIVAWAKGLVSAEVEKGLEAKNDKGYLLQLDAVGVLAETVDSATRSFSSGIAEKKFDLMSSKIARRTTEYALEGSNDSIEYKFYAHGVAKDKAGRVDRFFSTLFAARAKVIEALAVPQDSIADTDLRTAASKLIHSQVTFTGIKASVLHDLIQSSVYAQRLSQAMSDLNGFAEKFAHAQSQIAEVNRQQKQLEKIVKPKTKAKAATATA